MVTRGRFERPTLWLKVKCSTNWANGSQVVPTIGIEPTTYWLQVSCSTNWAKSAFKWWRLTDSNRWPSACKADALPTELNLQKWWLVRDSNPWMHAWKACELTVSPTSHMALEVGLEPTTDRLTADCSTNWAIQAYSIKWSGWWESNPRSQLGRLKFYHWTTPAFLNAHLYYHSFQSIASIYFVF